MYYNESTYVFLNGKWLKASEANASLYSQTLHYGHGVFEGIRSYKTEFGPQIFKGIEHYNRLLESASKMELEVPYSANQLLLITNDLLEKNNLENAYIRPLIYLGANMELTTSLEANILLCAWEWGPYFDKELIRIRTSDYKRPTPHYFPEPAKVVGQFSGTILATTEAKRKGYDDALLLDTEGNVACGASNNVFIEKDGVLFTPKGQAVFKGITRATVIELAHELDYEVVEKDISLEEFKNADAAFFTGTASGIVGMKCIDEYEFPLNWEESIGSILQAAYKYYVTKREITSTKVA